MRHVNFEAQRTHGQSIAGLQLLLADDAIFIHISAILAAEVSHGEITVFNEQHTVMATNQIAAWAQMAIFGAANKELLARDRDFLAGILSFQNSQLQIHSSAQLRKGKLE
jgi:hypothetical protein